jgi:molybdopterin/thiamine biosynthesis adenylyltransferase
MSLNMFRQNKIIDPDKTRNLSVTLIGAGAIGSEVAKCITKMGIEQLTVYDEDGITSHNIPNQFYRLNDAETAKFKVDALKEIVRDFCGCEIQSRVCFYNNEKLDEVVIVATDSMRSRRLVWEQFKVQSQCKYYIEARMGAEIGRVYTISKSEGLKEEDIRFYEETLYSDEDVEETHCSARAIMYNIEVIAGLIGRSIASIVKGEKMMREMVLNLANMEEPSLVFFGRY